MEHLCFSGSPACSGCNPCVACAEVQAERVLPAATVAAGLNGSLLALVHVFAQTLHQIEQRYRIGVDPTNLALSRVGVPLSTVFATPQDQVQAFYAAYREAWGRLVQGLTTDPALAARIVRTSVGGGPAAGNGPLQPMTPEEVLTTLRGGEIKEQAAPAASPSPAAPSAPVAPPLAPAAPPSSASYEAFVQSRAEKTATPATGAPLEADDIAAAGAPAEPSALVNGAATTA